MNNVTAEAVGGTPNYGVYNTGSSSPVIRRMNASATGSSPNYAVYNVNSSSTIEHSELIATTDAIYVDGTSTSNVRQSHLEGGVTIIAGGAATCLAITDASSFYTNTCP